MADVSIAVLSENNGRVHVVQLIDKSVKIKGIGVLNPYATLNEIGMGGEVQIGSKIFTRLPPRLPELVLGMKRTDNWLERCGCPDCTSGNWSRGCCP